MSAYYLVLDSDGPGEHEVLDAHDGCNGPELCGGCDACMFMQHCYWGSDMAPVHWVPTLPWWKREEERKRLEATGETTQ